MISAATWGRLTVQQVNAYQGVKSHNPTAYQQMVLRDEIGMRAYQEFAPCPWVDREDEQDVDGEHDTDTTGGAR
jgi:hypothetical protein